MCGLTGRFAGFCEPVNDPSTVNRSTCEPEPRHQNDLRTGLECRASLGLSRMIARAIPLLVAAAAAALGACSSPENRAAAFPDGTLVDLSHVYDDTTIFWPTSDRFRLEKTFDGITPE